ncbi:MAG: hypothetical protein ROW48_17265, partial [Bellilinea sp.]
QDRCRVWGLQGESVYRYYVILTISIRIMLIVSLLPLPVVQVSSLPSGWGDCFAGQKPPVSQ